MLMSYSFPPLTVDLPELTLIGLGKHLLPGIAMTRIYHSLILLCWYCWWTEYCTSWYDRYPLKSLIVLLFHMVQNFVHQTVGMSQNEGPPQVQNSRIVWSYAEIPMIALHLFTYSKRHLFELNHVQASQVYEIVIRLVHAQRCARLRCFKACIITWPNNWAEWIPGHVG